MNRLDRLREFNVLNYLYACNTPRQMLRLLSEDDEVQAEIRCCAITPDAINELFDNIINAGKTEPKTAFRTEFEMCVIVASYIISKVDARRLNAVADELAEALAKSRRPTLSCSPLPGDSRALPGGCSRSTHCARSRAEDVWDRGFRASIGRWSSSHAGGTTGATRLDREYCSAHSDALCG